MNIWCDPEEQDYVCACCGKVMDENDVCVREENMPGKFSCGEPLDIYCLDCVRDMYENWLEEATESVG